MRFSAIGEHVLCRLIGSEFRNAIWRIFENLCGVVSCVFLGSRNDAMFYVGSNYYISLFDGVIIFRVIYIYAYYPRALASKTYIIIA